MMYIGIDPGSNCCGYCIIDSSHKPIDMGTIRMTGKTHAQKMASLYDSLYVIVKDPKIVRAAVETPFINPKAPSAVIPLSYARGVILLALARTWVEIVEAAPSQTKNAVGCKGNAPKDDVRRAVQAILGSSELPPPDVADAYALALIASRETLSTSPQTERPQRRKARACS